MVFQLPKAIVVVLDFCNSSFGVKGASFSQQETWKMWLALAFQQHFLAHVGFMAGLMKLKLAQLFCRWNI